MNPYVTSVFYGSAQARIHDERFGALARAAAEMTTQLLGARGITAGRVVDLGCGSGTYANAMLARGFDVVGVDVSPAMVELARAAAPGARIEVGSVHDFAIPPAVAVTAQGEVLNYATDARAGLDALRAVATRAKSALDSNGVFVFDVSTPGRGTYERFHDAGDWSLGMHSVEHNGTLTREIVIYTCNADGTFARVDERHELRLYEPIDVVAALEAAGLAVAVRDTYDTLPPLPGWKVFIAS
jgi:SAM-dependent methyltransferase